MTTSSPTTGDARVGLREAKAQRSKLVRLVESGNSVVITDRGRAVAQLSPVPVPAHRSGLEDLERRGLIGPLPRRAAELAPTGVLPPGHARRTLDEDRNGR